MSNSQQPHYLQTQFAQQQQPKSIIDYNQRQNQVLGKYNFDYSQQQQSHPSEIKTADIGRSLTMPNNNNKSVDVTTTNGQNSNIWQQPSVEMQPHPFSKTPQFREQEQRSQPYPQVNLSHNLPLGQQIGIHNNNGSHMNNLSAQSTPLANNFNESLLGNFQNIYQQQQQQPQQLTQQQQLQLLSQLLANSNNNPAVQQQRPQEQQQQFQVRPSVQPQLNNLQFQAHSQNFNPPVNNQLYLQQLLAQQQLQQRQQQLQTAEHSLLNTPLESSRYSQQQPVQQEQQQYFAQNYQQIHDNLNQYKKLISYLENIETAKRTGTNFQNNTPNILPPQMQQMSTLSPMLSSQQQQRVDNFQNINNPSYNGMYDTVNSSIINLQPEEKIRPVQETLPLQQSFVMTSQESTPHQQKITTEPENAQILWPSSGSTNIELKSNRTFVQPSQNIANGFDNYNQLNQSQFNPISYDNNIEYENNQLSESYIDQKLTAINMDIQMKQNNNNIQILDVCQQHENDMSKASAEITKESLTEAQLQQITSEDNNKSLLNVNDGEQHFGMGNLSSQSHNSNHYNQNSDNNGTNNLNNDGNFSTSNDQLTIRDSEIVPVQADKPIVNHQMTFEELLESKLQEDMAAYEEKKNENLKPVVQQQPPKREFLRKSSNNRGTNGQENEQSKSKNKYKYYVDNFNNNGGSTNNITNTTNTSSQNVQKQGHNNFATPLGEAQSPKATTQSMRRTTIENSASNKKLLSTQKSNQKQPRQQQPTNKQTQRPQSQQQMTTQSVSNNNTASKNTARNRQNNMTPHISSLNVINEKDNIKGSQSEAPLTDEPISERNSVIEFEMLEQECIKKYNQQQQQKQKQEISSEKQVSNQQPQTQERSINNSASRKPIQQKEQQQQKEQLPPKVIDKQLQKVMEQKVQELDKEIQKFQKENKRVASMQEECEAQLKRINTEIEEFQLRKDDEMEDIEQWKHDQRIIIKKERQQLENEKELFNRNQLANIDQQSSEVERLMARINQLESENFDLKDRLDELTDKELHCIGVQTTPAKIYDAYTMTEEQQQVQVSQVDKNISPLKEQNFEPAIINQSKTNTVQLKTHSVYEDNMCHPIEQITEEDEDNFSKTNSEQPAEEGEQSPIHEGEESHPQEIAGSDEDEEEDEYDLKFPSEYHGNTQKSVLVVEEVVGHDGKVQKIYANGKKEVLFTNGVKREVWPDGYSIVYFNNNDIKQTYADGKIVYYFSEAKTTQSTYPNGLQVFKFANSQIEKHFADGTKEISFPDGTIKCLFPDGEEESIFPDGTIQKIEKNGVRIVEFPNGQRDVLYPDGTKVREFEDGSVKKIYNDGKIEILQSAHKVARNLHRK